jgi:hypothetical protein
MENEIIKAVTFIAVLQQRGFITEKEFSELKKYPIRMRDNECGWSVETPDRDFALVYGKDTCGALLMDLITDGIKIHGTYDERNLRINFDIFEYEKLLENFYAKI